MGTLAVIIDPTGRVTEIRLSPGGDLGDWSIFKLAGTLGPVVQALDEALQEGVLRRARAREASRAAA